MQLPLFPLKTVLFPEGVLPLKVFEQRYIDMTKSCLREKKPFGVCLITAGEEVGAPAQFANIGTLARITDWDMPQFGILHVATSGEQRFQVQSHVVANNGLATAEVALLDVEPRFPVAPEHEPLARLLESLIERIGDGHFPSDKRFDDASWVSYRLAEILPLKLSIKQSMLEINDSGVRMKVLAQYMKQQGLV
jgi:Lon protease-like protein